VTLVPGISFVAPSVFVIATSATADNVSVSVAELLVLVGSVTPDGTATDAVFDNDPVAPALIAAVSVYVAVPLANKLTVSLIEPVPEAEQLDPADAIHVHVAPVSAAGSVSVTVAPVTAEGPAFVATIV
jgi:hypothetical protein